MAITMKLGIRDVESHVSFLRHRARRVGLSRGTPLAIAAAALMFFRCFVGGNDITDPTGHEEPSDHEIRIALTNIGDGTGGVAVTFSAGTVTDQCPARLAPGESCIVDATHTSTISSASIAAQAGDLSIFAGFGGDCNGTVSECTISTMEQSVALEVEVTFDLGIARIDFAPDSLIVGVGAETSVMAEALADAEGTVLVEGAEFTWETSDPAVAGVTATGETGGTAIVSGVASGEAWIRVTARNGTDSLRVVVGG